MPLRQILRSSLRSPAFALTVALLVAVVVLVNATVFSAVWALNYKALPYRDGERLVELRADLSKFGFALGLSKPLYEKLAQDGQTFDGVVGHASGRLVRADAGGQEWRLRRITPGFDQVLGVSPVLGRGLLAADADGNADVVIITDAVWRARFAAAPDVLGRQIDIDGRRLTVVGVMPSGFVYPDSQVDAWMPFVPSAGETANDESGNVGHFEVVGRLAAGVAPAQARQRLSALLENHPSLAGLRQSAGLRADLRLWRERFSAGQWLALGLLQLAALVLLAVVAANLANLTLDRMLARQRDLSICRAVGARDRDIVRSVLADLLLPVLGGAVVGWLLSPLGTALLRDRGLIPAELPVAVGGDVATAAAMALAAALLLVTALVAALSVRSDAGMAAGLGARQPLASLGRARAVMVVVQVALTTALLGSAFLLLRSAVNLVNEPRGFDERGVLMTALDPLGVSRGASFDQARDGERLKSALRSLHEDVAAMPGVEQAAFATMAPFSRWEAVGSVRIPGRDDELQARSRVVGPGYFATLGIDMVRGRGFEQQDVGDAGPVIVDELFVQRWLDGRDPVGTLVSVPISQGEYRDAVVIGVARTVKHEALDESPELPTLYRALEIPLPTGLLLTRTSGDPALFAGRLRQEVLTRFPQAQISFSRSMSEAIAQSMLGRRAMVEAVTLFAAITLTLAVIGLYAVLSFAVRRRTAEFGVRMALGADAARVHRLVLGQGLVLTSTGLVIGLAVGMPLAWLIADRLHRIGAADPATWLAASAVIAVAALVACWWPARRATRVPPGAALRAQ